MVCLINELSSLEHLQDRFLLGMSSATRLPGKYKPYRAQKIPPSPPLAIRGWYVFDELSLGQNNVTSEEERRVKTETIQAEQHLWRS